MVVGGGGEAGEGGGGRGVVAKVCSGRLHLVALEVLPEGGGVGVGLVAPPDVAVVGLVSGVDVHVLLSVAGVCKPSVTSFNLTLKWFLA